MLPKTVGSENNLFEQSLPNSGAAEAESQADCPDINSYCQDECQEQQAQIHVNVAQIHSDHQAQSLDMGTGGENNIVTSSQDGTIITSVQDSSVPDTSV